MDLLKYEYMDTTEGSYNRTLSDLVKQLRYYRNETPMNEYRDALPYMRLNEKKLQELDAQINSPKRSYIDEIMKELEEESEKPGKFEEDLGRKIDGVLGILSPEAYILEDFGYDLQIFKGIYYLEFYGLNNPETAEYLSIAKEIFRCCCYKFDIVFVDRSE